MKKKLNISLMTKLALALALMLAVAFSACAAPYGGDTNQGESADAVTTAALQSTPAATTEGPIVTISPAAVTVTTSAAATAPAVENPQDAQKTTESAVKESKDKNKSDKADKNKKKKSSSKDKKSSKKKTTPKQGDTPAPAPKPNDKPKPEVKPTPKPADDKITVAISVDCATLYADDPDMASQVSNKGVVLAKKNVTVGKNATVYDVLKASGVSFSGTQYISSIGGLSEFDGGPESGWVFLVSGVYSGVGVTKFTVKNGDYVQFRYTLKGGADVK